MESHWLWDASDNGMQINIKEKDEPSINKIEPSSLPIREYEGPVIPFMESFGKRTIRFVLLAFFSFFFF